MATQNWLSFRKRSSYTPFQIFGLSVLLVFLLAAGNIACKKEAPETAAPEEEGVALKEGYIEFEGLAKVAAGEYLFVPKARGFDIVVQGELETGENLSDLVGKEVRGKGEFSPDRPSILVAHSLEVKDEAGTWHPVFTKTEDVVLDDYLDMKAREEFPVLDEISYDKKVSWEGKGKVKVFGKLEKENDTYKIAISDDKGKLIGRVIIDSFSDFATYHIKKLRLFDDFWFYITIKETVDWQVRRKTQDLFHADVLFAGLF